jgi:enoyl-CoA hydratase/carnithine racemase
MLAGAPRAGGGAARGQQPGKGERDDERWRADFDGGTGLACRIEPARLRQPGDDGNGRGAHRGVARRAARSEARRGRGQGADFCKGRDYASAPERAQGGAAPTAGEIRRRTAEPIVALYSALRELPVPALALVQGAAHGFGCALACGCDIVLAAEDARFRLPEMERGLPPTLAMASLLERIAPKTLAYLVYSTAELDARTALGMGLASALCPAAELAAQGQRIAETICSRSHEALRAVKAYLASAPRMEPRARGELAVSLFCEALCAR